MPGGAEADRRPGRRRDRLHRRRRDRRHRRRQRTSRPERAGARAGRAPDAGDEAKPRRRPPTAEELGYPGLRDRQHDPGRRRRPGRKRRRRRPRRLPLDHAAQRPAAVALVAEDDWPAAIAAAVLMAPPVRAPLLFSGSDACPRRPTKRSPRSTRRAATATSGAAARLRDGDVADRRRGRTSTAAARATASAAATAAAIADLRDRLFGSAPEAHRHRPAGAARLRDARRRLGGPLRRPGPVRRAATTLPKPTAEALKRHTKVPVYVLGPPSAISEAVLARSREDRRQVQRVAGEDPVANAIAFARYADGGFGWNINDPGHGFVLARERLAARRRRRGAALGLRHLGPVAAHRRRRYAARRAARLLPRREARLHRPTRPAPTTTTSG